MPGIVIKSKKGGDKNEGARGLRAPSGVVSFEHLHDERCEPVSFVDAKRIEPGR